MIDAQLFSASLARQPAHGRAKVYFDASCGFCSQGARVWQGLLRPHGFDFEPLQDPKVEQKLGLSEGQLPEEMKLETPAGRILGGVDAVSYVARRVWWMFPLHLLLMFPLVDPFARVIYTQIARNRGRISHACHLKPLQ